MEEQLVLIVLKFPSSKLESDSVVDTIWKLQELLEEAVEMEEAGYVDGHEFSDTELIYFIYGPSADRINEVVKPIVVGLPYLPGSYIIRQYTDEEEVVDYLAYD